MCGRYTLIADEKEIEERFEVNCDEELPRRYNIAPSQDIVIVRAEPEGARRVLTKAQWGLIPKWAKDPGETKRSINARTETLEQCKTFEDPFKYHRCLIPANGFYEWKAEDGGSKRPYYIRFKDGGLFAFAGLWEQWQGREETIDSAVIITTESNPVVSPIHNRMPVILPADYYQVWLDPENDNTDYLVTLLRPYESEVMTAIAVGPRVNSPRNDDPSCIEHASTATQEVFSLDE